MESSGSGDASLDSANLDGSDDHESDDHESDESDGDESSRDSEFGSEDDDYGFGSANEPEMPATVAEETHEVGAAAHDHDDLDKRHDAETESPEPNYGFALGGNESDAHAEPEPSDTSDLVVESLPTTPTADADPVTILDPPNSDLLNSDSSVEFPLGGGPDEEATSPSEPAPTTVATDSDLLTETTPEPTPDANELDLSTLLAEDPEPVKPTEPPKPEVRVWTRTDGRTARAVFIRVARVDDTRVVVISPPDNDREFKLPMSALSSADLQYVKQIQQALQALQAN